MMDLLIQSIAAPYEAIRQVEKMDYQAKIQRLESALKQAEQRAEYYYQLYIHEKQLKGQSNELRKH